jgi:acetolactate synthase-1/2/3 large subunit
LINLIKEKDRQIKYSDYLMGTLKEAGFSTCFFLAGGNSMHLIESASKLFECIPVVHEVTAAIAAEYFNQTNPQSKKAFALVTAGPGLTNLVTGIGGAWLESRELLVIGGQSKSSNLARGKVRQIGHQEIDGISIVKPITKISVRIESPIDAQKIFELISKSWTDRPGPVFLEVCLDISAKETNLGTTFSNSKIHKTAKKFQRKDHTLLLDYIKKSKRPLLLLGGGVTRKAAKEFQTAIEKYNLPIACTWTGADRVTTKYKNYAGRPNMYGMRWANIFQQQSDLVIAVGTSLGYQQTGFNTDLFAPLAEIIHVDIDKNELKKPNPRSRRLFNYDSAIFLEKLLETFQEVEPDLTEWSEFLNIVREKFGTLEKCQKSENLFISPYEVIQQISNLTDAEDVIVSASSGGTFTATLQSFEIQGNQTLLCNKGLASMGYGLAGAIGASKSKKTRTVLFEGDGGFAQNMQDLGTVVAQNLNIKIFITSNDGYASIKTSQKNYFQGHYLGCDSNTGLILPEWAEIFSSYNIPSLVLDKEFTSNVKFNQLWESKSPAAFIIKADPNQIYLPKISSKIGTDGVATSNPLHEMDPPLSKDISDIVFRYMPIELIPSHQ